MFSYTHRRCANSWPGFVEGHHGDLEVFISDFRAVALLFIQLMGDRCDFFLSEVANKFSARPLLLGKTEVDQFTVSS